MDAKRKGERIRITIYEKNSSIMDTTIAHLVPNLTPYEILAVVPRGKDLQKKLDIPFSQYEGLGVSDVPGVNDSGVANAFKRAVLECGLNEEDYHVRTETLLALGKMSMELWQEIYATADDELKQILVAANFHPCNERSNTEKRTLYDGYRIDITFRVPNAINRVKAIKADYERLGYMDCQLLSPDNVCEIDPFLTDFCMINSELTNENIRVWKNDTAAVWRPGGCLDTKIFLPLFEKYLETVMGKYTNENAQSKNCFRIHYHRKVNKVDYETVDRNNSARTINGLMFFWQS